MNLLLQQNNDERSKYPCMNFFLTVPLHFMPLHDLKCSYDLCCNLVLCPFCLCTCKLLPHNSIVIDDFQGHCQKLHHVQILETKNPIEILQTFIKELPMFASYHMSSQDSDHVCDVEVATSTCALCRMDLVFQGLMFNATKGGKKGLHPSKMKTQLRGHFGLS